MAGGRPSEIPQIKSAFLLHAGNVDVSRVRTTLERFGLEVKSASDLRLGASWIDAVMQGIQGSDCVVAVLGSFNGNVAYELGLATATGKPVLLVLMPDAETPSALVGFPFIRLASNPKVGFDYHLKAFLMGGARPHTIRLPKHGNNPDLKWARDSLHLMQAGNFTESQYLDLVANSLKAAGGRIARELGTPGAPDLVAWLDDLETVVGNPVVIEIKRGPISRQGLDQAIRQTWNFLKHSDARYGFVLYDGPHMVQPDSLYGRSIMALELQQFLALLESGQLAELVRRSQKLEA